jgi:Ni,Fe-hydrogenase III large subunit
VISGARRGRTAGIRRLVSAALARDLAALVVPGPEIARAFGLDLSAAGLLAAESPRRASVLLVVGELSPELKRAAGVAYAQMPRPRAVLAVGAEGVSPLPGPDVSGELSQESLVEGVRELRRLFAEGAFASEVEDFDVDELRTQTGYGCPMHPEVTSNEPGSCPKCGMDLIPQETAAGAEHDHHQTEQEPAGHEEEDRMDAGDHHGHEHTDHEGMDFMSMVEMTRDLPRSSDGLQMEWVEAPFGPLFPGLPGGLDLRFTLDGDAVAEAQAVPVARSRSLQDDLAGLDPTAFADRLGYLDPHAPVAYRMLARRAFEAASGVPADERTALVRAAALEHERAASHLNWLANFAYLLGYGWLERRAARLQLALLRTTGAEEISPLAAEAARLSGRVLHTPLLRRKLGGIGCLTGPEAASGPVARASGAFVDARTDEEVYIGLGFEPVVLEGGDALSRLRVRLLEVERSLDLCRRASPAEPESGSGGAVSGTGSAVVETPRGAAKLRVGLDRGMVVEFELITPSAKHLELISSLVRGEELANALLAVGSLDISPWEVVS